MLEGVRSFIAKLHSRSARRGHRIVLLHETGFRVHPPDDSDGAASFEWLDITEVIVFKRDCISYDLICLAVADRQPHRRN